MSRAQRRREAREARKDSKQVKREQCKREGICPDCGAKLVYGCPICGAEFKTSRGVALHRRHSGH